MEKYKLITTTPLYVLCDVLCFGAASRFVIIDVQTNRVYVRSQRTDHYNIIFLLERGLVYSHS